MKTVKLLLSAAFVFVASASMAQQDFSSPQYAKWGDTPEAREKNILNSNFLKEACDNRDYQTASHYLGELVKNCPDVSAAIYQRGAIVYKNKINRAKSLDEKKMFIDSLLLMYDLRNQYFGDDARQGSAKILDMKAREVLTYMPSDRGAIRDAFRAAIEAGGDNTDPETVVAYFSNFCDDYKNTDEVTPDEVIAEYERLSPYFVSHPDAGEYKNQFEAAFGLSGAASCENLEKLFKAKLVAAPNDPTIIGQAVNLMSRAKCDSEYYFQLTEQYYTIKPSSETALFLAQAFQAKGDYAKAIKYLNEALAKESVATEREKLLVRISLVNLVSNDITGAASAARQARELNPESGQAWFVLGQCYANSAAHCGGFVGQTTFWAAYDAMQKAVELLQNEPDYLQNAKTSLGAFRSRFPSSEEMFFNEIKEGARYTVNCGTASGIVTSARAR